MGQNPSLTRPATSTRSDPRSSHAARANRAYLLMSSLIDDVINLLLTSSAQTEPSRRVIADISRAEPTSLVPV